MNTTLNKYLAKHHSVKLDANGSVIEIFKGELDNLVLDEKALVTYKDAKSVIDVPNSFQMWDSLVNDPYLSLSELVETYDMFIRFLETPLTLNMFIAVDEDGKFMEDISLWKTCEGSENHYKKWKYLQTVKRCVFEGWRLKSIKGYADTPSLFLKDTDDNTLVFFGNGGVSCNGTLVEAIGDLIGRISLIAKIAA